MTSTPDVREIPFDASEHVIRWYGVIHDVPLDAPDRDDEGVISRGPTVLVPRNRFMKGRDWGWEVRCSCGWESHTGGAIQERVREEIARHKWNISHEWKRSTESEWRSFTVTS